MFGRRARSLVGKTKDEKEVRRFVDLNQSVDLEHIAAAVHHGCMNLPQELVDHIMDTLHDDTRTLKACSLTCKAMFASTRRLIHQTLWLTPYNSLSVLTQDEYLCRPYTEGEELRFLSHMGESGLLRYSRRVHICTGRKLTPGMLLPHLRHFQSLDHVHTLILKYFDPIPWADHHRTCFLHLYPTLTSLIFPDPTGPYRLLIRFALQFPNLENLTLDRSVNADQFGSGVPIHTTASQPTPLRLRLVGYIPWIEWPLDMDFINFRSVEFDDSYGKMPSARWTRVHTPLKVSPLCFAGTVRLDPCIFVCYD